MMPIASSSAEDFDLSSVRDTETHPEHRLMLAVLEDAVMTYRAGLNSHNPLRRRYMNEVEEWLRCRESDSPFSFECICETLGLDPGYIRAGLRQLQRRSGSASPPRLRIRREPAQHRRPPGDRSPVGRRPIRGDAA